MLICFPVFGFGIRRKFGSFIVRIYFVVAVLGCLSFDFETVWIYDIVWMVGGLFVIVCSCLLFCGFVFCDVCFDDLGCCLFVVFVWCGLFASWCFGLFVCLDVIL